MLKAILDEIDHEEVHSELLESIVKHLGPSVFNADAELVSGTDPEEIKLVKKIY